MKYTNLVYKELYYEELYAFSETSLSKSFGEKLFETKINEAKKHLSPSTRFYIESYKNKNIEKFLKEYNELRNYNNWPLCSSIDEWYDLSDDIKSKCFDLYNHNNFFNPTVDSLVSNDPDFKSKIFKDTGYTLDQLTRLKNIIDSNIDYIRDSDIIEFAAGDGLFSAIALSMGAKSTVTTDISDYNINLCKKTKDIGNFDDTMTVLKHDIENFEKNELICKQKDVVLISGILPLIDNKIEILKSITNAKPTYIIISELLGRFNGENDKKNVIDVMESSIPSIQYTTMKCESNQSPFWSRLKPENFDNFNKNSEIISSNPNVAWYHFILNTLGYKEIKFHRWSSTIDADVNERFTAVYKLDNDKTNK